MKIRGAAAAPAYRPGSGTFPDGPAIEISAPRDRDGSFEPKIVKKRQKRLTDVDEMVISVRILGEVQAGHLAEVYGADVSRQTISTIIDKAMDGMAEWQNRPRSVGLPRLRTPLWCCLRPAAMRAPAG